MNIKINKNKFQFISVAVLIIVILIMFLFTNKKNNGTFEPSILIFYRGDEITEINGEKININKNMTFTIGDEYFGYNTIEIKDGNIRCIDADCPDEICVKHGALDFDIDNDMIVCAPHSLLIKYNY